MKRFVAILITAWLFATASSAQKATQHEADLLVRDGDSVRSTQVLLSAADGALTILAKKAKKNAGLRVPFSEIKKADYSYSRKSQVWEGLGNIAAYSLLCGCVHVGQAALFIPYAFTKKKQHWLVIDARAGPIVLKLGQHDYRDLMLELNKNGINVTDSGERLNGSGKPMPN